MLNGTDYCSGKKSQVLFATWRDFFLVNVVWHQLPLRLFTQYYRASFRTTDQSRLGTGLITAVAVVIQEDIGPRFHAVVLVPSWRDFFLVNVVLSSCHLILPDTENMGCDSEKKTQLTGPY